MEMLFGIALACFGTYVLARAIGGPKVDLEEDEWS